MNVHRLTNVICASSDDDWDEGDGQCCCNNYTNWRFDIRPWWDNMERATCTFIHHIHSTVHLNRTYVLNTHTRSQSCIVTRTITRPYTQHHHRWLQSNGTDNDDQTNNYLCRFVVLQEKCCSFSKAVNRLRSSYSFASVFFFSHFAQFRNVFFWHRITFTVFFHFYYYWQHLVELA